MNKFVPVNIILSPAWLPYKKENATNIHLTINHPTLQCKNCNRNTVTRLVTVDEYWTDNWIYYNRTLKYNTTESLRSPSVLQLTIHYITTTMQSLSPPQPLFWHPLPTQPGCCRTAGFFHLSLDTNSLTHHLN
jgi:hypothetical protein